MIKIAVLAALVAVAAGRPQVGPVGIGPGLIGGPGIVGHPRPHHDAYHYRPFAYEYAVRAPEYGNDYSKTEHQDESGNVDGEYRTLLPDGRIQIVTYHANDYDGYIADVKYEGEPHFGPGPRVGGPIGPIVYY